MTALDTEALEERLRRDLPDLADAMTAKSAAHPPPTDRLRDNATGSAVVNAEFVRRSRHARRLDRRVLAVAASMALLGGAGVAALGVVDLGGGGEEVNISSAAAPQGAGTWRTMAPGPLASRSFVVSAWTGSEMIYWAGSNEERSFAHTDGATYDPSADSWGPLTVPGWGHPGLVATYVDEALYVFAKGGGSRFDPAEGTWTDLPSQLDVFMVSVLGVNGAIYGLGPVASLGDGQPDIGLLRLEGDEWVSLATLEGSAEQGPRISSVDPLASTVFWTGEQIVVWDADGSAAGYDPETDEWTALPALESPVGEVLDTRAVVTESGVAALVEYGAGGVTEVGLARLDAKGWVWVVDDLPLGGLDGVSAVAAGEWVLAIRVTDVPVAVHVPSGVAKVQSDSPIGGRRNGSAVWTGSELIIWGGDAVATDQVPEPAVGAIWTPPAA